jgi:hypothetical protein
MPASCTLRALRRAVLPRVGYHLASTVTAGTVSSLTDATYPVKSSNDQSDLLAGKFLLRPDAAAAGDKVRVVAEDGYDPPSGRLQPDSDWSAPPAAGEVYEVSGSVEPWTEFNALVAAALARCYLVDEIALTATAGARRHGLNTAAPWLVAAAHVRELGYLWATETRTAAGPYRKTGYWSVVEDGGGIYVEHPSGAFDGGETLYARCLRPAATACRPLGGDFGDQTGLAADTDEAPVALEWAAAAVLVEYWDRYAGQLPEGDPGGAAAFRRQQAAAAEFTSLTRRHLTVPPRNWTDRETRVLVTGLRGRH